MSTFNSEQLRAVYDICKAKGYRCYASSSEGEKVGWFYYENQNGQLGYVQYNRIRGLRFSTKHKPSRENGSGFGASEDYAEPTEAQIDCVFTYHPSWAKEKVEKWHDFNEYQEHEKILEYSEI